MKTPYRYWGKRWRWMVLLIALVSIMAPHEVPGSELLFIDKTLPAGLSYPPSQSSGSSWGDFDQDGFIDLYIRNHAGKPSLYRNRGNGAFQDAVNLLGITSSEDFHGASWGDFDNDGDMDLYQTVGSPDAGKVNHLFRYDRSADIFTDVAPVSGVENAAGRGRTPVWIDYDHDGRPDLFVANIRNADSYNKLYHNNGDGTFSDRTLESGLDSTADTSAAAVDFDEDGYMDLILPNSGIFRNNGKGTFSNLASGMKKISQVNDLAVGDYDNDGDLDLYLARSSGSSNGDVFTADEESIRYTLRLPFHDEKGFDFTSSAKTVEFTIYRYGQLETAKNIYIGAGSVKPAAVPFTLDSSVASVHGIPDYLPASDNGTYIWFDPLGGTWHIRHSVGAVRAAFGVTLSSAGIQDVVPAGLVIDTLPANDILYRNDGNGRFTDVTGAAGIDNPGQAQSVVFEDFDNDGNLDIYVVNSGLIANEPNILYKNSGNGTFVNVASSSGAEAMASGRGESVTTADYNNDGFMDILVLNGYGLAPFSFGQRVLLENQKNANNWLQIRLAGTISNRDGLGARVNLVAGTLRQKRQQTGGMHTYSQNTQVLQFGLGSEPLVDRIAVFWPSGIIQQRSNIGVNQRLVMEEPKISPRLIPDVSAVSPGEPLGVKVKVTNNTGQYRQFLLAASITLPDGTSYPDPVFGPAQITLAPYQSQTKYAAEVIPADAPAGTYTLNAYVGSGPRNIWNEDHVDVTVLPSSGSW